MASMIVLTGRFGSDPNFSQGEKSNRASFRFASSEWEQGEEHTDWFSVSCFGKLADRIANQGQKGKKATLWGRLRIRKYTTKEGEERVDPSVTATHIEWTEPKDSSAKYGDTDYKRSEPKGYGAPSGEPIPF
jgi:single-strand DNA-binding protein